MASNKDISHGGCVVLISGVTVRAASFPKHVASKEEKLEVIDEPTIIVTESTIVPEHWDCIDA